MASSVPCVLWSFFSRTASSICVKGWRICHAIYATARNGLWDDPVEATTGTVFERFRRIAETENLGKATVPYLTWRYCYLQCTAFFGVVWALTSARNFLPDAEQWEDLFSDLPGGIRRERFDSLVQVFAWWDTFLMLLWLASFLLLMPAIVMASPRFAVHHRRLSRRLVWTSWLFDFAVPFLILMLFPFRSLVDWEGVQEDICVASVLESAEGQTIGIPLPELQQRTPDGQRVQTWNGGASISEEDARRWCQEQGDDWLVSFQGGVDQMLESARECEEVGCADATDADLRTCLSHCMLQARGLHGTAAEFQSSLVHCNSTRPSPTFDHTTGPSSSRRSDLEMFNTTVSQTVIRNSKIAQMSNNLLPQVEYLGGLLVSIRAGSLLISASLSVLGGLAEALLNVKALFPASQEASWILILTTCEALAVDCALLAVLQQLIGDHVFSIICGIITLYTSLSGWTGLRAMRLRSGESERWRLYRKIWVEYGFRFFLGGLLVIAFSRFTSSNFGDMRDRLRGLDPLRMLLMSLIDYYARKTLMAIASTDAILTACLQTECWRMAWSPSDAESHEAVVNELGEIILTSRVLPVGGQAGADEEAVAAGRPEATSLDPVCVAGDEQRRCKGAEAALGGQEAKLRVEEALPSHRSEQEEPSTVVRVG